MQLLQHRVLLTKSETVTSSRMYLSQEGHLFWHCLKSAASVEVGAPGILHGASGIGAATLTGIHIRDTKFRPGGPAGPKFQAQPGFLRSPN